MRDKSLNGSNSATTFLDRNYHAYMRDRSPNSIGFKSQIGNNEENFNEPSVTGRRSVNSMRS